MALENPEKVSNNTFLRLALKYLVYSLENQVYYHLSDYAAYNRLPRFMSRLSQSILDNGCDHAILLEFHPRLVSAYKSCISDLKISEHSFSSDANQLIVSPSLQCIDRIHMKMTFVVSLIWENAYERGLSAARQIFQ